MRFLRFFFPFQIRELLTNELDDDLLDDDNASFSSHDFRSSIHGAGTPYSEISTESPRQYQPNGQFMQEGFTGFQNLPSHRGAFERLPLVTPRGFQLIQQPNTGRQVPHLGDTNSAYHDEMFNQNQREPQRRGDTSDIYTQDNDDFQPRSQPLADLSSDNYSSNKTSSGEDYRTLPGDRNRQYEGDIHHFPGTISDSNNNNRYGENVTREEYAALSPSSYHHWREYDNGYDQNYNGENYQQSGLDAEHRPGEFGLEQRSQDGQFYVQVSEKKLILKIVYCHTTEVVKKGRLYFCIRLCQIC